MSVTFSAKGVRESINMSTGNAAEVLDKLGLTLDDEGCGSVPAAELAQKCAALASDQPDRALAGDRSGRIWRAPRPAGYVSDRARELGNLASEALKQDPQALIVWS